MVAVGRQSSGVPGAAPLSRPSVQIAGVLAPQRDLQIEPLDRYVAGFGQQTKVRANHAVVLDLYSRKVVGWQTGDSLDSSLVTEALKQAWQRKQQRPDSGVGAEVSEKA